MQPDQAATSEHVQNLPEEHRRHGGFLLIRQHGKKPGAEFEDSLHQRGFCQQGRQAGN